MSNTEGDPGASTATATGEPETPQATPTREPGEKPRIKITKNENGTFHVDDLQFKVNSMNDSTITLTYGDKKYKIGKKNNTYTIDGVTFQIQSSNIQTQPNGSMMVNVQLVAAPSVNQAPQTTQMNNQQRANIDRYIGTKEVQQQAIHWHLIGKDMEWNTEFSNFVDSKIKELQSVKDTQGRNALFQKIKELNPSEKDTLWNLYLGYQFNNPSGRKNQPPSPKTPEEVQKRLTGMADFVQEKYKKDFNTFVGTYGLMIEAEHKRLQYNSQFPQQSAAPDNSQFTNPTFVNVTKPPQGGKKRASRKMRPSKMSKRLKTRRVK